MDTMFVMMLKDFGKDYKANEVYELDGETAKSWVVAGLAEERDPQGDLVSKFSKALEERDTALLKAIKESAKIESKAPSVRVVESEDDRQKGLGHFFQSVHKALADNVEADVKAEAKNILNGMYKASLQVSSGIVGGYTVPEQFINQLVEVPEYSNSFGQRAIRLPIEGESGPIKLPALDQSVTPAGDGQSAWGAGVNVFWDSEGDDAQEVNPKFRQIELNPNRMSAYIPVSNHLLRSSAQGVESIIRRLFQQQVNSKLEYSWLMGDGVGKPLGMLDLNNGLVQSVTRDTASVIKFADVCEMWEELPASSQATSIWMVGQKAIAGLLQMVDAAGNAVFHPSAQSGIDLRLFNRPVFVSEFLPAVGTPRDLCLVDPSMYYAALTYSPTISLSEHVRFLKGETVFKMELWADGQPAINYKPKLANGATISPAIYLN